MKTEKLILFGGTFDPVHSGHITVSKYAMEHIGGDKLIMIPTKRSPLKHDTPTASDEDRMNMLSLSIKDCPKFEMSDWELRNPPPSYTLRTVKHFLSNFPRETEVYWLAGCDTLGELPGWYHIEELMRICTICIMYRGGYDKPDFSSIAQQLSGELVEKLENNIIETPRLEVSSTEIRNRLKTDKSTEGLVDEKVLAYIRSNRLYQ